MMKTSRFLSAVLIFSLFFLLDGTSWASAAEMTPESSIRSIVVYPDRAMIRRSAAITLSKGENVVKLSGITPNLINESVEVSVIGANILEVKTEKTFLAKIHQEKMNVLEERLETLNGLLKARSNEAAVIQNTVEFLKRVNPFGRNEKISSLEIEHHVNFIEKSLAENYKELATIEDKTRKLSEEKRAVEEEMKHLRSSRTESKNILISLRSDRDFSGDLVCSYIVTGVSWKPLYDVRVDTQTSRVELGNFAVLKQSTEEDWKGVSVEISTARPSVSGNPPELSPWYVDVYKPTPALSRIYEEGLRKRDGLESKAMAERDFENEPPPLPKLQTEATSFTFVIPGKVDVPADNQPHRLLLASASKDGKLTYSAFPSVSKYAFLKTDVKNPFSFPLLPGGINLFADGKFVSTASLQKTILAEEPMGISLGIDESIKIERKPQKNFSEIVGTFTRETRENYETLTEVINGKAKEITIDVKDNCPVSKNEKIKVTLKTPAKEEATISEDGMITWTLRLAPGEKKQLRTRFTVTYPLDVKITGLD
jgi:uncharacterized protein (TIGR02231 family)